MMSGHPAAPGDGWPNWITTSWPPETTQILSHQWEDVALPYSADLVQFGQAEGLDRIAVEMHGNQLVCNVPTLLQLRDAVGDTVGANIDPSHLIWMEANPTAAVHALGSAIYHVHAKESRVERSAATRSLMETLPPERAGERAWNYTTLGYWQGRSFWRDF